MIFQHRFLTHFFLQSVLSCPEKEEGRAKRRKGGGGVLRKYDLPGGRGNAQIHTCTAQTCSSIPCRPFHTLPVFDFVYFPNGFPLMGGFWRFLKRCCFFFLHLFSTVFVSVTFWPPLMPISLARPPPWNQ